MTCFGPDGRPSECRCRRDGLDPKTVSECLYRGLRKRGEDDWARLLDDKTEVVK